VLDRHRPTLPLSGCAAPLTEKGMRRIPHPKQGEGMTGGPPDGSTRSKLRAALASNLDFTFAGGAALAYIVAQIIHPTALCGSGAHPSALFVVFAFMSCAGFLVASFLACFSREHVVAKIALFLFGLGVTLIAVISLAIAASPTGLGFADSDGERSTMQSVLRRFAAPPAPGKHAYWLGPHFRKASVDEAEGYWSPHVELTYTHNYDNTWDPVIWVRTYRGAATNDGSDDVQRSSIVHTKSGQDVRITIQGKPDAAKMAEARAAVQVLPRDVKYSGCD